MKYLDNINEHIIRKDLVNEFKNYEILDEKIINFNPFEKVWNFIKSKVSFRPWIHFGLFLQKIGLLKKYGIKIISYSVRSGVNVKGIKFPKKLNEDQIKLEHPNDEIINLDADQLKEELMYQFTSKEPIFIWGAPGIGKTEIVAQVAKKMKCDLITFTLSVRDPIDFLGLPSIEKGKTVYNVPGIFPPSADTSEGKEEEKGNGGILFFDEMNQGNQMVLNASMRLILDRKLDNYILPKNWVIFAAGNREEEAPSVTDLSHALANRMTHVNYVPDVDSWIKWARSEEGKIDGKYLLDPNILAFIKFNNKYFHYLDPDINSPAWASPRSWTKASEEYIKRMEIANKKGRKLSNEEITNILGKRVGQSTAIEFVAFLDLMKTVDINKLGEVYKKPQSAPLPPKDGRDYVPDKTYAMLSAIAFNKDGQNLTIKEFENLVEYAIKLNQSEYASSLIQLVSSLNKHLKSDPAIHDILKKWYNHYKEFLTIGDDGVIKKED